MATQTTERYCPICGKPVTEGTYNRFGEWCCSDPHADEYVAGVRAQKQGQAAASAPAPAPRGERHWGGCCG
ncbi:MAG: hypothetical protein HY727_15425 [Candidatus Rokubacteria bacterium]|nr:hypothetical protein [Candidatus Rokubacteria bacterium]